MVLVPVLISAFIIGAIFLLILRFLYGFEKSDFLLLAATMLPMFWRGRFSRIFITVGDSPFVLFFGILGLIFFLLIWFGNPETREFIRTAIRRVLYPFLVLLFLFLLSIVTHSKDLVDFTRGILAICFVLLPFMAALAVIRCCRIDELHIERAVFILFIGGIFTSSLCIITAVAPGLFRGIVITYKTELEQARGFATVGGTSPTVMYLILIYCLASGQLLAKHRRLLSGFVVVLSFLGILATQSRAALPAFAIANIYLYGRYLRNLGRRMLMFLLIGGFLLLPSLYLFSRKYSLERLTTGFSKDVFDRSRYIRIKSAKTAGMYGLRRFAFGGGWGLVYDKPRRAPIIGPAEASGMINLDGRLTSAKPHNLFALTFAEAGGLALVVLLFFCYRIWKVTKPPAPSVNPYGHGVVHGYRAGLVGFFVMCIMQDHLFLVYKLPFLFYLFVFMGIAASSFFNYQASYYTGFEPAYNQDEFGIDSLFAEY